MLVWAVFVLLIASVAGVASAISCSSRFYCHTEEIKYMGLSKKENIYLNVTIVSKYNTKNITECQRICNRDPRCFSININKTIEDNLECQLLGENIFSSASKIISDLNFIHLFMESPCSRNPCKNNGTCVPQYKIDSYTCECVNTSISKSFGKDCEKTLSNFEAADYYWTFDSFPNIPRTGTNSINSAVDFISAVQAFPEPGRRTAVGYCYGSKDCTRIYRALDCVTKFADCASGFTYSFWFKLRHLDKSCSVVVNHYYGTYAGSHLYYNGQSLDFKTFQNSNEKWQTGAFGTGTNFAEWTHVVLTYNSSTGVCAYLNGNMEVCQNSKQSASVIMTYTRPLQFGYQWSGSPRCELYVDDFAVWKTVLAKEDVSKLYMDSRM